ncbi:MAG: hypothetical protein LIO53_04235 [Oscillospiraceae bacterium]|nr:hypothetical protein [Oscillospiraceae bacterium]
MEFKELYQKYIAGNCTDEEKAFVEEEIKRAQAVSDEVFKDRKAVEFTPVTDEEVLKAKNQFAAKNLVKTVVISLAIGIALIAVVTAAVFGLAVHGARKNMRYSGAEAETMVAEYIVDYVGTNMGRQISGEDININYIYEDERDLQMRFPLSRCYYIFEYEVRASGFEFEVEFNPKTGECIITDIDRD